MFLCVNANSAVDKTVVVPGFELDRIHRPKRVVMLPGGKGINTARGLHTLGEPALITGWAGGHAGQFIANGLAQEGLQAEFVWCSFESRTCLSILDPLRGTLTELYENGEAIPPAQIEEFKTLFARLLPGMAFVTLAGSLPPGIPPNFYAELVRMAAAAGVPAALDCGGEALRLGLEEGHPALIKPNQAEFQGLIGRPLNSLAELSSAALEIAVKYNILVVLSLGARGAVAARAGEVWQACPPQIQAVSAVGSGDCLLAGIVQSLAHGAELPEALRRGVAAGSANTLTVGAGRFSLADFEQILSRVEVTALI